MIDTNLQSSGSAKDDVIVGSDGRRYRINSDGSITALDKKDVVSMTTHEQAINQEHANLDYLINNHPDRLDDVDAACARRAELEKEMGIDSDASARAFQINRKKILEKIGRQQKSVLNLSDIMRHGANEKE